MGRDRGCLLAPSSREEITMKRFVRFVSTAAIVLLFVTIAAADTLELKDGRVLDGRYLGGTQAVLRFQVEGNIQTFNVNDVVALTFTHSSGNAAPPPPSDPAPAPAPAPPTKLAPAPVAQARPIPAGGSVTIPAGQSILVRMIDAVDSSKKNALPGGKSILVRMIDGVDSSKNHVGDIF